MYKFSMVKSKIVTSALKSLTLSLVILSAMTVNPSLQNTTVEGSHNFKVTEIDYPIFLNGEGMVFTGVARPLNINGHTMVPLRVMSDNFDGVSIDWQDGTKIKSGFTIERGVYMQQGRISTSQLP